MMWSHPCCYRRSLLLEEMRRKNMESKSTNALFQEDNPRKEIDLSPQVGDINLGEDLNLLEKL
jgi:hypothetical protein